MLCWDGFLRKTPLENSHFGSSFLHAIFPLPLIMDHTSWNKYWVAFKRQVKTTAISEKEHLAFSLYQELKSQPTGIPETYSIRKLKKKFWHQKPSCSISQLETISAIMVWNSVQLKHILSIRCVTVYLQLFLFAVLNLCSFVKNMYLKPCLSILLFFICEPQQ